MRLRHQRVPPGARRGVDCPAHVDRELGDDEHLEGLGARVIYTPGHTYGSIAFLFEEAGVLFTGDVATEQRGQVVLGPFDDDRPTARRSFRKFADIEMDAVCFGHGQPLVGEETNKLKAAARADEVPDPLG
jgi:glyoxylase-like metal-dependent hydrolase (beta-lactamase superfamily II)